MIGNISVKISKYIRNRYKKYKERICSSDLSKSDIMRNIISIRYRDERIKRISNY